MANHVLVDFYLANVTLAEGKEHVNVTVTGPGIDKALEAKVEKFGTPLYLDNLQNGSYEVKTELVDGSNKLIEGPWNSTTRSIKNRPRRAGRRRRRARQSRAPAAAAGAPAKPGAAKTRRAHPGAASVDDRRAAGDGRQHEVSDLPANAGERSSRGAARAGMPSSAFSRRACLG